MTLLIISTCKEKLLELEFVKPIERILTQNNIPFTIKHYTKLTPKHLNNADKIIISGTSLNDEDYLNRLENFSWIKYFSKPILGICAGAQIIQLLHDGKSKPAKEIGKIEIHFANEFLGINNQHLWVKEKKLAANFM